MSRKKVSGEYRNPLNKNVAPKVRFSLKRRRSRPCFTAINYERKGGLRFRLNLTLLANALWIPNKINSI